MKRYSSRRKPSQEYRSLFSLVPGQKPMKDVLGLTIGNSEGFSWQACWRELQSRTQAPRPAMLSCSFCMLNPSLQRPLYWGPGLRPSTGVSAEPILIDLFSSSGKPVSAGLDFSFCPICLFTFLLYFSSLISLCCFLGNLFSFTVQLVNFLFYVLCYIDYSF